MKTLGIIGGIGPESTLDYYRLLIAAYRERKRDGSYPLLLINSIDLTRLRELFEADRLEEVTEHLLAEIGKLARAGADFALMAANTPHRVFDDLSPRSPIPLLSIVEATAGEAQRQGLRSVGLLGTRFTMEGRFYPEVFARRGIAVRVPGPGDQAFVHDRYMGELVNGVFRPETREEMLRIVRRLVETEGVQGVLLAGTELPLLLRDAGDCGVPLLDTTVIHVAAAVDRLLGAA